VAPDEGASASECPASENTPTTLLATAAQLPGGLMLPRQLVAAMAARAARRACRHHSNIPTVRRALGAIGSSYRRFGCAEP
jgi:hypothetical protein